MASLYFHIPFCQKKCPYCDFYSVESARGMDDFLDALLREISSCGELVPFGESVVRERVETIFFGGGTPSVLTPSQLERILARVHEVFAVVPGAEITLEANPGRVDAENLRGYRALGVNRLSLGVQSFHEKELRFLGRIHGAGEGVEAIEEAREAGFENLSLDLIYGLPGQTREEWEATLHAALKFSPEHISAYSLIVEEGTPLARMVAAGVVRPSPLETEAALFEATMDVLAEAGYEHYEVSNYAKRGFRCRHNLAYWSHANYLGFGPSAHSFWHDPLWQEARRWWNIANVRTYGERLREGKLPVASGERLEPSALINERIFLGLRSDGVRIKAVEEDFRFAFQARQRELVRALREEGLAVLEEGTLRLTSRGYLLCDEIGERFFL
jgi:oxygen-independent coproporphyrinogen-3 oxidase